MFTRDRITTPRPTFAPNNRSNTTFTTDGTGTACAKNTARTAHHTASFHAGTPRENPSFLNCDKSIIAKPRLVRLSS
jgi:hypothetical protein